ncbi:hypothetical protein FDP41_006166 [Naegleria fowleri]|uniref:BTB domain-containing protein n=1 Tax=Naegleria fowleri TaxID=5763 RepID=A0A6A5BIL0_NAEFO|nr:uncharacterized protein FDP41_006166 [Naegleria fowleri]KAF0974692.1 hypothetical protein FDP41_006166 [Naegleria fowleri]CAG4713407.1 unnamed protein product [Naegleria fowleri]
MSNKLFGSKQHQSSPPAAFCYKGPQNAENIPPTNILSPTKSTTYSNTPQKVSTPRKMLANMKAKVLRKSNAVHFENDAASTSSGSSNGDEQANQHVMSSTPKKSSGVSESFDDDYDAREDKPQESPEAIRVSMNDSQHKTVQIEKKILKKALPKPSSTSTEQDLPTSPSDTNHEEVHKDLSSLSDQLNSCVFDKQFSDFVIQCGPSLSTKYYAHRVILASRSSYFRALLSNTSSSLYTSQQRYSWEREDIHPEVFGKVLEYLYTGQVRLRLDNVLDIFVQSEEFGIPCLKRLCELYLIEHGDYENMALLLEMAIENKALDLVKHCYQYIDKNIKMVLKSDSIKHVKMNTIIQIISRDSLQLEPLEEVLVFESVQKWCELRKHLPFEASSIAKVIEHVRYPLMSSDQLATVVEPSNLVPQHPLLFEAYKYHLVPEKNNQAPRFRTRAAKQQ